MRAVQWLFLCNLALLLSACGTTGSGYYRVARGDTLFQIARKHHVSMQQLVAWNQIRDPNKIHKGQRLRIYKNTSTQQYAQQNYRKKTTQAKYFSNVTPPQDIQIIWPAEGNIIEHYTNLNKGINISNHLGTTIHAAAKGQVVYVGNGLRGYGNLIILKHAHRFLTAYAHNHKTFVHEGQTVSQGQEIAEMGNTDSQRVMLHFELRYDGQSLNPIDYLPAR